MQERSPNDFGIAFLISIAFAIIISIVVLAFGKFDSFQLINSHNSPAADFFFRYITYAGDGMMWLVVFLFCIILKRKYLVAAIAGILISTLVSQFLKRVVYPEELRPITYLTEAFPVHIVEGVSINRKYSFPSGHACAAFTMALIVAHMINKKFWSVVLPIIAFLVGYSRVYLAQHFLTDVLFGTILGIISAVFSLLIFRSFSKYVQKKATIGKKDLKE